jgi:hypothetical protein
MKKSTVFKMKNCLKYFVLALVCIGIVIATIFLEGFIWNDGQCFKCEKGSYIFVNADYEKDTFTHYFYKCDNCDEVICLITQK